MMQEITGDSILDGTADIAVEIPQHWTPEYAGQRLVWAFDVLRRTPARIGPKEFGNAWPEYLYERGDINGRGSEYRKERENLIAHLRTRPGSLEIELADESFGWPAQYLADSAMHLDAVMLWASCKAHDQDAANIIGERRRIAMEKASAALRAGRDDVANARELVRTGVMAWVRAQYVKRKIAIDAPALRQQRTERLRLQGEARLQKGMEKIESEQPDLIAVMPGKCLSVSTWRRFTQSGLQLLADRLERSLVAVR